MKQTITERDVRLLTICNSAPKTWGHKQAFYKFKSDFLNEYGKPDGFDIQKIEKECWGCNGTGIWRGQEECYKCEGTGIYENVTIRLDRYKLRGELFHCPAGHHIGGDSLQGPKSTIIGLIYHKQFQYNPSLAYAELLYKFDIAAFWQLIDWYNKCLQTRAKHKLRTIAIKAGGPMDAMKQYFGYKEEVGEELPF